MLDESVVAPCKTLAASNASTSELSVFLIQANFIKGGLLCTFCGQHGSMDMTGLGQIIYLLAKACRNKPFTPLELSIGNMARKSIIPSLEDYTPGTQANPKTSKDKPNGQAQPGQSQLQHPHFSWAYFSFSAASLAALKSLAVSTMPLNSFVSTDDVLGAFIWQSITRARQHRLENPSTSHSTLSRNVDVRSFLSIPLTYPGFIVSSTHYNFAIDALINETLGKIAAQLRSALDPETLRHLTCSATTAIKHGDAGNSKFAATSDPGLNLRLSSWAKEKCYDLDFGFGKPEAVRRPRFTDVALEGLVYLLPKTLDDEVTAGVCLRDDDLDRLKGDKEFVEFGAYIG